MKAQEPNGEVNVFGWKHYSDLPPNSVDTRLSHCRPRLELGRGVIAEGRATAFPIGEHLDVLGDILSRFFTGRVVALGHELALECSEKAFATGVVPAIAGAAHAARDAVCVEQPLVATCGVPAPAIRVVQEPLRGCAMLQGHRERVLREIPSEPGAHRPANHGARVPRPRRAGPPSDTTRAPESPGPAPPGPPGERIHAPTALPPA